jgi:hypothetical protein
MLIFLNSGKATLGLSSSQSVSFRHGTNVEFNSPGFSPGNPTSPSLATDQIPPMDSYNLETLSNKNRDFSNPMYDAVQSDSHMGKSDIKVNHSKMTKNKLF